MICISRLEPNRIVIDVKGSNDWMWIVIDVKGLIIDDKRHIINWFQKSMETSSHKPNLKKYIWKNVEVQKEKTSDHNTGNMCTYKNLQRRILKMEDMPKYHLCETCEWRKIKERWCVTSHKENYMWYKYLWRKIQVMNYVQNSHKEVGICVPYTTQRWIVISGTLT